MAWKVVRNMEEEELREVETEAAEESCRETDQRSGQGEESAETFESAIFRQTGTQGAGAGRNGGQKANLDFIMSVPLPVTVEIGRAKRKIRDILEFTAGTILPLDKLAGDAVDVLVNGTCIARGEVVVIDDYFGVRITEIHSDHLLQI